MHRPGMVVHALAAATLAFAAPAPGRSAECRQALALGLDVSGSVDAREYRLQLDGLAVAFGDARVRTALLAMPSAPVQIMVYEWSGPDDQYIVIPWTVIAAPSDLTILRETLRQSRRRAATPGTALGPAISFGAEQLGKASACWHQTLDISGDGTANSGIAPTSARDAADQQGITINALAIGADAPGVGDLRQADIGELSAYFRANVITGPDAFVQTAIGYDAYAEAMAKKLARELKGLVISQASTSRKAVRSE